jgi:hypothetical protein
MPSPYQGMYVLDPPLVDEHFRFSVARSPLVSRVIRWGVRERASLGPIFDEVPHGMWARNAVPLVMDSDGVPGLDTCCLVEHLAAVYVQRDDTVLGSVRLDEAFQPAATDARPVQDANAHSASRQPRSSEAG